MNHVEKLIPAWLAGELSTEQEKQLFDHLDSCQKCAAVAARDRQVWAALESVSVASGQNSVWPQVRKRTLQQGNAGWFFGSGNFIRTSLAATALAFGLYIGVFVPGGSTINSDDADRTTTLNSTSIENQWMSDSSWMSGESSGSLAMVWLGLSTEDGGDGS